MAREALSKRTRFEVFKRDQFVCQYCGAHPPDALLHVDHIIAVANGGTNDTDNLVTACQDCNLGKGAIPLSAAPQSLADKAAEVAEREAQLRGYSDIMAAKRERLERETWEVMEVLVPGSTEEGVRRDWFASVKRFVERLGFHATLDAAEIARARHRFNRNVSFRYFCGICWRRIRGEDNGSN